MPAKLNGLFAAYRLDPCKSNANALHAALLKKARWCAYHNCREAFDTFATGKKGKPSKIKLTPDFIYDMVAELWTEKLPKFGGTPGSFNAWVKTCFYRQCVDAIRKVYLPGTAELKEEHENNPYFSQENYRILNRFEHEPEEGVEQEDWAEKDYGQEISARRRGCSPISPKGLDNGSVGLGAFDRIVYQQGYSEMELDTVLEEFLSSLEPIDRSVVSLRLNEAEYPEIAKELGISEDNARYRFDKAIDAAKKGVPMKKQTAPASKPTSRPAYSFPIRRIETWEEWETLISNVFTGLWYPGQNGDLKRVHRPELTPNFPPSELAAD